MYACYCRAPGEDVWPLLQHLTYTYQPAPLLLPPIQAHNFCSRPRDLCGGEWAAPREYHCFHATGAPLEFAPPFWVFPPAYAAALRPPFPAPGYLGPSLQAPAATAQAAVESGAQWPEGGTVQAELRWGRVERALGPRLELPDSVRRELRRVYGTYPRTNVRVTYRGGEFLLRGSPRLREPENRRREGSPVAAGQQRQRGQQSRGGSGGARPPAEEEGLS